MPTSKIVFLEGLALAMARVSSVELARCLSAEVIGEFPDSVNRCLGGLPLAGTFTILIDTELGENRNLEPIEVEIVYGYHDLFVKVKRNP